MPFPHRIVLSAQDARQGEIILKRPWQRLVFFGGFAGAVLLLLVALLLSNAGY